MLLRIASTIEVNCGAREGRVWNGEKGLVQERWVCPAGLGTSLLKDCQMLVWVSQVGRSHGGSPKVRIPKANS